MIRTEIWRPIRGFEGLYEISSYGNVKALAKRIDAGHCHRDYPEKIMRPADDKDGYLRLSLYDASHKAHTKKVHRLVADAFIGNPEGLPQINHKDGNKKNNHVNNLEWCTNSHNMKHAVRIGLIRLDGIHNPNHKLRIEDVDYIKKHFISRDKDNGLKALAVRFGVNKKTIANIIKGETWTGGKYGRCSGNIGSGVSDGSGHS